jgi:GDP/UDP-N,N'-diacetylbacillosamine 2-epimerase (hydrolysing)
MTRTVCVVTGTRAEYGLLRWVMDGIRNTRGLELQVVVTGMHLSPEFGLTFREIENDGFEIDRKVEMLLSSDSGSGVAKSIGLGVIGFADALKELSPDLLLVLGDRFEILSAVLAATTMRIPVAHLHGGETTQGAIDEPIRHSITKMSHLHFVAAPEYRRRVIQLGEAPGHVFLVGGLGVDCIRRASLLTRGELEDSLGFSFAERNLLVTFHPVTLEVASAAEQMSELLAALEGLRDTNIVLTLPNADTDGRVLFDLIERFVAAHPNTKAYTSLGQQRYLSCVREVDGVVGNSSSGLTEVPSFRKGTVNIGDRQRGRLRAATVIDCAPDRVSITAAINELYSPEFKAKAALATNPYGDGGASDRIVDIVRSIDLDGILKKKFHDLPIDLARYA